jgi:N-acetyl sugar amidotransferase
MICKNCVMDDTDPDISFNTEGICNHCQAYWQELSKRTTQPEQGREKLIQLVSKIKKKNPSAPYHCVIGLSGGVDSTYLALLVNDLGLRPLAIHFDNGWNSELAIENIRRTTRALNIDLVTYVVDWAEFRSLQLAFLRASTPDGEVPTDHAISAILFKMARKHKIKYIFTGMNFSTETCMPKSWAYGHMDWRYIRAVMKTYGTVRNRTYPYLNLLQLALNTLLFRIKIVSVLNYIDYNKFVAEKEIIQKIGWEPYTEKHHESIYTRFYQGYLLIRKFKIDKRRAHLSSLILSGQIKRYDAIKKLKYNNYIESKQSEIDKAYVMKKMSLDEEDFENIMQAPISKFQDFPNHYLIISILKKFVNYMRLIGVIYK